MPATERTAHGMPIAHSMVFIYKYLQSIGEKQIKGNRTWGMDEKDQLPYLCPVLKYFRTGRKLTQKELAEKVGLITS